MVEHYEWQRPFEPPGSKTRAPVHGVSRHMPSGYTRSRRRYTKAEIVRAAGRNARLTEKDYRYPRSTQL